MIRPGRLLLAIAALAAAPATQAQTHELKQVGPWHIMASRGDCTGMYHYGETDILIALIYPQPGTKKDAALMLTSERYFGDAKDEAPYPVRLALSDSDGFDSRWHDVVPTGFVLSDGKHGIRIAAPAQPFGDSLEKADTLRLEGIGHVTLNLEVQDMHAMVEALRTCAGPQG